MVFCCVFLNLWRHKQKIDLVSTLSQYCRVPLRSFLLDNSSRKLIKRQPSTQLCSTVWTVKLISCAVSATPLSLFYTKPLHNRTKNCVFWYSNSTSPDLFFSCLYRSETREALFSTGFPLTPPRRR